jgi:carotenoid cleavage dioxygenase-like enzyme
MKNLAAMKTAFDDIVAKARIGHTNRDIGEFAAFRETSQDTLMRLLYVLTAHQGRFEMQRLMDELLRQDGQISKQIIRIAGQLFFRSGKIQAYIDAISNSPSRIKLSRCPRLGFG